MHPKKKRFQYGVVLLNIHVYIYAYIFIYLKKFYAVGKHLRVLTFKLYDFSFLIDSMLMHASHFFSLSLMFL